jgi:glycosyltransferase involved in cell wall biosynthesis
MRIIINALAARSGGALTYLTNITPILAEKYAVELIVLAYEEYAQPFNNIGLEVLSPKHHPSNILARVMWEMFSLPRIIKQKHADIYFAPSGMLGCKIPKPTKSVVAFRNMLPFSPEEIARFHWGYNKLRYLLLRRGQSDSFRKADLTVFISNFAKSVIDSYVPDRQGQSIVIHHGVSEVFRKKAPQPNDRRLEDGMYLLYVSPIKPYKAQLEVIESWFQFRQERNDSYKLVFAGSLDGEYSDLVKKRINELGLNDSVILLGNVPHAELPGLYQHARIIIFASSCENCPNVLIESLNSGRPVLCSNIQPMPEFGGDSVEYFDPYQPDELADLLTDITDDKIKAAKLAAKSSTRGIDFNWVKTVDQLMLAFNKLTLS